MIVLPPAPAVPPDEIFGRINRVREAMSRARIGALLLTSQNNVEYFSGYRTLSWTSNTRPVFLVIGRKEFVLIGSTTEERNLATTHRLFRAQLYRGFIENALPVAVDCLCRAVAHMEPLVALDYGRDTFGRGSIALLDAIHAMQADVRVIEGASLIWAIRIIKTQFEAELKRTSFRIANHAFDEAIAETRIGISESDLSRTIQARIVAGGADRADPFPVVFGSRDFAYNRPPSERRLAPGDYVWTDFRSTYGGYPADRNRIAKAGQLGIAEKKAYAGVRAVTLDVCKGIRPGMTGGEVYSLFESSWHHADLGQIYTRAARIGHGGGMDLTEPPSITAGSTEVIEEGMVLHIEPKLEAHGGVFQCEEVIHVGDRGNIFLTEPCPEEVPIIG